MRVQKFLSVIPIVALVLICVTILGVSSYSVSAACVTGSSGHPRAIGTTQPGVTFYGGTATFPEQSYVVYDWQQGGFVINSLWNLHTGRYWEEVGFGRGWNGQNINFFYIAFNQPVNGYFEMKLSKSPQGVGTSHTYSIYPLHLTGYLDYWYMRVDSYNTYVRMSGVYTSNNLQVGGEMSSGYSSFSSTTSSSLQYYTGRNQQGATNWPNDTAKTKCVTEAPLQWAWVSFPTSGRAWK